MKYFQVFVKWVSVFFSSTSKQSAESEVSSRPAEIGKIQDIIDTVHAGGSDVPIYEVSEKILPPSRLPTAQEVAAFHQELGAELEARAEAIGFSFKAETHNYPYGADHPLSRPDLFYLVNDIIKPRPDADLKELSEWERLHGFGAETGIGRMRDIPVPSFSSRLAIKSQHK
jgi:hypothetical protein